MPLHDDFLFNLRPFSNGTGTDQEASGSSGDGAANTAINRDSSSILAGLNAFTPEDREGDQINVNDFAEQLELWTNANFSFDGPTGHALLLDDEKDADAKREQNERREQERERESQRTDRADVKAGKTREGVRPSAGPTSDLEGTDNQEAALHREHKLASDKHHYFAPPSTAAEGRRPGHSTASHNFRDPNLRRHAENSMPNGTADHPPSRSQQPGMLAENAFSQFSAPRQSSPPSTQSHSVAGAPPLTIPGAPFGVSPELMQAIAFQQILSGANPYNNPLNLLAQTQGGYGGLLFPTSAGPFATGFDGNVAPAPQTTWAAPAWTESSRGSTSGSHPAESSEEKNKEEGAKDASIASSSKKRRYSSREERERAKEEEEEETARALREEIPPLKLIDTGNPEADAEANRAAIEEDKRRRNTAASARFRVKKKQREQALEQSAKILEDKVKALEDENARLTTENGWLKSLITIRPGTMTPTIQHPFPATMPGSQGQPGRDTGLHPRGVGTRQQKSQSVVGGEQPRED